MAILPFSQDIALSLYNSADSHPIDLDDAWQWLGYSTKQKALQSLKSNFESGLDFVTERSKVSTGGRPKVCVKLTVDCFEKLKTSKQIKLDDEKTVQAFLHKKMGGVIEVITPVGRVDLLTSEFIVEIKNAKNWKSGLGQLLVYHGYYPSHGMNLVLFGSSHSSFKEIVECHCLRFGIKVDWFSI